MNELVLVPARGGSKGIPGKNIKLLGGKPLIHYTLDAACSIFPATNICVSTDSDEIIDIVRKYGLEIHFKRPDALASDTAGTYEVILHALHFFESLNVSFGKIILLQPTSPFRSDHHIREALSLYTANLDMVVSVKNSKSNPYFNLFEETELGYLAKCKNGNFLRRQDSPPVYEYNGAIYIINTNSLKNMPPSHFKFVRKYVMTEEDSLDIDTPLDFFIAQSLIEMRSKYHD